MMNNLTGTVLLLAQAGIMLVALLLDMASFFTQQKLISQRAFWACATISNGIAFVIQSAFGLWVWLAIGTTPLIVISAYNWWRHRNDDDDDWPGPKRGARWLRDRLRVKQPQPIEVPR